MNPSGSRGNTPRATRPSARVGYVVVVFGAVTYVWGCFLPIFLIRIPFARSFTLYNQIVDPSGGSSAAKLGGTLFLFAGVTIVAALAIIGALSVFRPWVLAALVGAVVVWSLTSIALLIDVIGVYGSPRWGYWILLSSIGCVVAGTIVALVSARTGGSSVDVVGPTAHLS